MAASDSRAESAVIASDPSRPFTPRQLIRELLRTRYCVPGSVLLVEGIEAHVPVSKRYRTVRLLLGDGELCLQALLRPELHRYIDSGQVFVGCYVRLNRFELKSVLVRPTHEEADSGSGQPEDMVFLVARDLSVVGWNPAYMQMAGTTLPEELAIKSIGASLETGERRAVSREKQVAKEPSKSLVIEEVVAQSGPAVLQRTKHIRTEEEEQQQHRTEASTASYPATDSLPWTSSDLTKPLKLTPLKSIPNLPYKQNWIVNILAVVASLSDVEPAGLPPFKQRIARLADPSTSKQVHLTVFLDAETFAPAVGSVVLLLGVKNHRFDGGSLKKYGNEKHKERSPWWLQDPKNLDWCDVDGLKKWWNQQASQQVPVDSAKS